MRLRLLLGVTALALALPLACAGQDSDDNTIGGEQFPVPEAGVSHVPGETDAGRDAGAGPRCSRDGWCAAELPEPAPIFEDLWPLSTTAFAVGNGLFEFDGARWVIANDRVAGLTAVWASGPDDVWAGGSYGRIFHGVRTAGTWRWTDENIGSETVLSLWGDGGGDVYAVTAKRAYHRASLAPVADGSAPWRVELEDEAVPDPYNGNLLRLERVSGSGPEDVWVSGFRGDLCSYIAHKTTGKYELVADCESVCVDVFDCRAEAAPPALFDRWTSVAVLLPGRATALKGEELARIVRNPNGTYGASMIPAAGLYGLSLWGPSETDLYNGAYAQVRHNPNIEEDGGSFKVTSIALASVPLVAEFKIRGTSPANVWAFGGAYALHKTKP